MSYHPDPHGLLGWEEWSGLGTFERYDHELAQPTALASSFSLALDQPRSAALVELVIVYSDLLEQVDEITVQRALRLAAPAYFQDALNFARRPDLLNPASPTGVHHDPDPAELV